MKAVVLVGGEGTRLRPLTFTTPKPLLPIANQPLLERQLAWLAEHGVDEVVLSMGYLPDAFHAHFAPRRRGPRRVRRLALRYAVEDEPLGTAGAIRFAADGIDERFVVCNGDVLTDLDLGAMVRFHDERGAEATISLTQVEDPSAFGVVPTAADGEVIAFVEKPPPGKAPSNWINAGTYVLEPSFLDRIPPRLNVSVERETFPRMLAEPGGLFGYRSRRLLARHRDAREVPRRPTPTCSRGRLGAPPAPGAREIAPGVWMQGDATIDPSAEIVAPVLLGRGRTRRDGRTRARVGARRRRGRRSRRGARPRVLHDASASSHGSARADLGRRSGRRARGATCTLEAETIVGAGVTVASRHAHLAGDRVPSERVPDAG